MNLRCDSDGLYWTREEQLYVPDHDNLRKECFESVHCLPFSGHYGVNRTVKKAHQLYYWPHLAANVQYWIKRCDSCQRVKAVRQKPLGKLQCLEPPGRRWESVSMDLITDLPKTAGDKDSIYVVVDRLSKMCRIIPIKKTVDSLGLARVFRDNVFKSHGMPDNYVSDRDPRFGSQFWIELHRLLGVKLNKSTAAHAQSDGQTENANGVLEDTMRHFVGPFANTWEEAVGVAEFAMNNAWNDSIQNTPFMLNYGQHPRDPISRDLAARNPAVQKFIGDWDEQVSRARKCLLAAQQRHAAAVDGRRRDIDPELFQPGKWVLLKTSHFRKHSEFCRKLAPRWVGPFKILEAVGSQEPKHAFKLELPSRVKRMHPVFNVSSLRPYYNDGPYQPPPLPEEIEGELEYEVDCILSTRGEGKQRKYLVNWKGYPDGGTWEPASSLTNCDEALELFWQSKGLDCPHRVGAPQCKKARAST